MYSFTSRQACRGFLREKLGIDRDSPPDALLDLLVQYTSDAPSDEQPGRALGLRLGRWVVRDQDLDVFRALKETFVGFASGQFVFSKLEEAALSGIVFGVLGLVHRARQAGTFVSPLQARILMILGSSGRRPLAVDAIQIGLRLGGLSLSHDAIRDELRSLTEVPTAQGPEAFVRELSTGDWMTTGL